MAAQPTDYESRAPIPEAINYLVNRSGKTLKEVSKETGIAFQSLYSMSNGRAKGANILTLKKLADYFHEDISIFCGLDSYTPREKLSDEEKRMVSQYRLLTDKARMKVEEYIDDLSGIPRNLRATS